MIFADTGSFPEPAGFEHKGQDRKLVIGNAFVTSHSGFPFLNHGHHAILNVRERRYETDRFPQDKTLIRMNVDNFEEGYQLLLDHGFQNALGDGVIIEAKHFRGAHIRALPARCVCP